MGSITKLFHEKIGPVAKEHSFFRQGDLYYRLVGDVLQSFQFKKYSFWCPDYQTCTVEFEITPLAIFPFLFSIDILRQNLRHFTQDWTEWQYKPLSPEDAERCVREIVARMREDLFPFFEQASNCEKALPLLLQLEYSSNEMRKKMLRKRGSSDEAGALAGIGLQDDHLLWMALKSRDYNSAIAFCRVQVGGLFTGLQYERKVAAASDEETPRYLQEKQAYFDKMKELWLYIEERNQVLLDKIVAENETANRAYLQTIMKKEK